MTKPIAFTILAAFCIFTAGCGNTGSATRTSSKNADTIPVVKEEDVMPIKDTSEGLSYKFQVMDLEKGAASGEEPSGNDHTVSKGETLYGIAKSYGVSLDDLIRVNGIEDPSRVLVGQKLIIPEKE